MVNNWKLKAVSVVLTVVILSGTGLWLLASYRKSNANAQQLIGTWKLISGGWGETQVIEFRDDGSLTTSSTTRGKTSQFDGKYRVGSRRITLTARADRRPPMDWDRADDSESSQQSSATQATSALAPRKKDAAADEEVKLEDAVMEILSLTKSEFVIAETDGHRLIYRRQ